MLGRLLRLASLGLFLSTCDCTKSQFGSATPASSASSSAIAASVPAGSGGTIVSRAVEFTQFQPALAVRGAACLMCHAQVASNMITDFGHGDSFYLGGSGGYGGSAYGDGRGGWSSVSSIAGNVYVPAASTSGIGGVSATSANTLAALVAGFLAGKNYVGHVIEKQSIYIGAPTADLIRQKSGVGTSASGIVYLPAAANSPALSGLSKQGGVTFNTAPVICEGDVAIEGPVNLQNLQVTTVNGCRIYVTGTVFIDGPITMNGGSSNRNLQVVSSRAVMMGFCHSATSVGRRLSDVSELPLRPPRDASTEVANIGTDASLVETAAGSGAVACSPNSEGTTNPSDPVYTRLLVNAPYVQSLYAANFTGTVVAEISMFQFGNFKFTFDPVFANVPVVPLTGLSQTLQIAP